MRHFTRIRLFYASGQVVILPGGSGPQAKDSINMYPGSSLFCCLTQFVKGIKRTAADIPCLQNQQRVIVQHREMGCIYSTHEISGNGLDLVSADP